MTIWYYLRKRCRSFFSDDTILRIRKADGRLMGMIQVRRYCKEFLERYDANIGYSVRTLEQRKGYAAGMLKEGLCYCKELGIERVLISCLDDNEESRRMIVR